MDRAIVVDKLVKNFEVTEKLPGLSGSIKSIFSPQRKTVHALKGISFSIQSGELVGFVGPNGAGKTTTLKVLSGLLHPTHGFTEVLDYNPWERNSDFLKRISVVFGQKNQLWWDLPAMETFELNRMIYEIPTKNYEANLKELVDLLGVGNFLNTPVRKLSLGQRMKMELIASLLHRPEVLFLDEPTIGLDLVAQQTMRDFIYEYNKKYGATIILTSHNMDDLIDLARRVIVIDQGIILYDGSFESLVSKYVKEKIIKATLKSNKDIEKIESIGEIKKLAFPLVTLSVPRESVAVAASELLQNYEVDDLNIEETSIEDVIRKVFKNGSLA